MKFLISSLVLTVGAAVIGYFGWRKIVLCFVIVGAAWSFMQGYWNQERANRLETTLGEVKRAVDFSSLPKSPDDVRSGQLWNDGGIPAIKP